jgi:hypothetical protein
MKIISPSTILPLVYLIQDHTDVNTYYVQVVVKDSRTGSILQTINLTDGGNRRFTGNYSVPTTEDMFLDITTSVYSDAGYTTKAQDKYEILDQYQVKTQWGLQFGGVGGSGPGIDYKKIKKMIDESISKIEKPEKYDDSLILNKLNGLKEAISMIEMPDMTDMKPKPVDFSPIMTKMHELSGIIAEINDNAREIRAKEFPIPESFDYEKITSAIEVLNKNIFGLTKLTETNSKIKNEKIADVIPKIQSSLAEINKMLVEYDIVPDTKVSEKSSISARARNLMGNKK